MNLRSFWQNLLRPGPVEFPPAPPAFSSSNPGLAWLDAAGLPWRSTRAELVARFGVHADNPYRWNLVSLDVRPPPLTGMLWPFGFQVFERYNPAMPPERLSTHVWVADDAEANIDHAAAQLTRVLGPQPVVDRYNTRRAEWRWNATLITLVAWPPAMQSGPALSNPAHGRDPRLMTACSVSVQTGWRPPLSVRDRAWLNGFTPVGPTRNWASGEPHDPASRVLSAETLLEFMRDPPADVVRLRGKFGLSADKEAMIICDDALFVIPLTGVNGFEVRRTLPAKGGGGSELSAVCGTGYAACPSKSVPVAKGSSADDLNEIAADLAAAAGKPFKLSEYDYDC